MPSSLSLSLETAIAAFQKTLDYLQRDGLEEAIEFKTAQPKSPAAQKKKNCTKAYSCAGSCVQKRKACKGNPLSGQAGELAGFLDKVPKTESKVGVQKGKISTVKPSSKKTLDKAPLPQKGKPIGTSNISPTQPKPANTDPKASPAIDSQDLGAVAFADPKKFSKVGEAGWHDVEFVQDGSGATYAKKQTSSMTGNVAYDTASEVIATNLMQSVGIKCANVSCEKASPSSDIPVHLYSQFVPGKASIDLQNTTLKGYGFDSEHGGIMIAKEGSFSTAMKHPDLARIHAFDVFSFNGDRHGGNLFYDEKSDTFHAIDNEGSFSSSPQSLLNEGKRSAIESGLKETLGRTNLSDSEKANIAIFKQTLESLSGHNPQGIATAANNIRKKIETASDRESEKESGAGSLLDENFKSYNYKDYADRREKVVADSVAYSRSLLSKFESDFKRLGL